MRTMIIGLFAALALTGASLDAQVQHSLGVRPPSINFGVPVRAHTVGCEHEDARAAKAGWNLAVGPLVYRSCQPHVISPTAIRMQPAQYTAAALREKIAGTVVLLAVVDETGTVSEARVLQSLDSVHGLDANAIDATMRSSFTPGRLGARNVKVAVVVEQQFVVR